jgi:hypothetical protein
VLPYLERGTAVNPETHHTVSKQRKKEQRQRFVPTLISVLHSVIRIASSMLSTELRSHMIMINPDMLQSTALLGLSITALRGVVRLRVRANDGRGTAGGCERHWALRLWRGDGLGFKRVVWVFLATSETHIIFG